MKFYKIFLSFCIFSFLVYSSSNNSECSELSQERNALEFQEIIDKCLFELLESPCDISNIISNESSCINEDNQLFLTLDDLMTNENSFTAKNEVELDLDGELELSVEEKEYHVVDLINENEGTESHYLFSVRVNSEISENEWADTNSLNLNDFIEEPSMIDEPEFNGQWSRYSLFFMDIGPSEDLYYRTKTLLTFGLERSHPFFEYSIKFLKACKRTNIEPDPKYIDLFLNSPHDYRFYLHLIKLELDIHDPKFQEFKIFLQSAILPVTSVLLKDKSSIERISKWSKIRKIVLSNAIKEIKNILKDLDRENFKEIILTKHTISPTVLDVIIAEIIQLIDSFVSNFNFSKVFLESFYEKLHSFILKTIQNLGTPEFVHSLLDDIKMEIAYLLSSPIDLVLNYSAPNQYLISPNDLFPIF